MESRPVKVININESLRSMLCELYESDFIFDKFEIALQASGGGILTGGYGFVPPSLHLNSSFLSAHSSFGFTSRNRFSVWNQNGQLEHSVDLQTHGELIPSLFPPSDHVYRSSRKTITSSKCRIR
jgi:hypothetical protein